MPDAKADYGKKLMSWKFPEYAEHDRGKAWYFIFFLVGGAFIIYSLATSNFLFMVLIIIIWAVIFITSKRKPASLRLNVFEDGVQVEDRRFYAWEDINKFWLIYRPPEAKFVYFNFKSNIRPDLAISLEKANPIKLREFLLQYLEEDLKKEDESMSEVMSREYKI